ncbi:MAG TPA: hypothetical protein VLE95_05875 [Chlamydiales bacterium]|nr:hypothetical protein [Chlamydiales bacterium]
MTSPMSSSSSRCYQFKDEPAQDPPSYEEVVKDDALSSDSRIRRIIGNDLIVGNNLNVPMERKFITVRRQPSDVWCYGRDYFPIEVDSRTKEVGRIRFNVNKPTKAFKLRGFHKSSAIREARNWATQIGVPFVPPKKSTCSIL